MSPDVNSLPPSTSSHVDEAPQLIAFDHLSQRASLGSSENANHDSPAPMNSPTAMATASPTFGGHGRSLSNSQTTSTRRQSNLINGISIDNSNSIPDDRQLSHSHTRSPRRSFNLPLDVSSPSHGRQISLGELHQELENEQEAQVNRLLSMIRLQQEQLTALTRPHAGPSNTSTVIPDSMTEGEDTLSTARSNTSSRQRALTRNSSHRSSRGVSPALRPSSASLGSVGEDLLLRDHRDEATYYQTETQNLTRENQMLKNRIRELEHQIAGTPVISQSTQLPIISSFNANTTRQQSVGAPKD